MGYLGNKPEVRFMPNGTKVATFSLATNEVWKDKKSGEKKERTDWHQVQFIGPLADVVVQYLDKGSFVFIQGKLRSEKWTDKEGQVHYGTKINSDTLRMLDGKQAGEELAGDDPVDGPAD